MSSYSKESIQFSPDGDNQLSKVLFCLGFFGVCAPNGDGGSILEYKEAPFYLAKCEEISDSVTFRHIYLMKYSSAVKPQTPAFLIQQDFWNAGEPSCNVITCGNFRKTLMPGSHSHTLPQVVWGVAWLQNFLKPPGDSNRQPRLRTTIQENMGPIAQDALFEHRNSRVRATCSYCKYNFPDTRGGKWYPRMRPGWPDIFVVHLAFFTEKQVFKASSFPNV